MSDPNQLLERKRVVIVKVIQNLEENIQGLWEVQELKIWLKDQMLFQVRKKLKVTDVHKFQQEMKNRFKD